MTFVRSTGGGANFDVTRNNNSGGALAQGTIVAPGTGLPDDIEACDISDPALAASRPVGIVVPIAGIANSASGDVRTVQGSEVPVLLVTGLAGTVALGDEIIVSTTAGRGTVSKAGGTDQPASSEAINRVGVIISLLTYNGAGDDLVQVELDFSARRIAS